MKSFSHILQIDMWGEGTNWHSVQRLNRNQFNPSSEDNVINFYIVWGLKNQDRSECHFTDYKCKGKTVLDRSFDMNPPPCQIAMLVRNHSLTLVKINNWPRPFLFVMTDREGI